MKKLMMLGVAVAAAFAVTGCKWCSEVIPGDLGCIEPSHDFVTKNPPETTAMVTPNVAISREVFRPVFRAGAARLTVNGTGSDRENAINDAIAKFLAKANCDYIVSVSTVSVKEVHPKPWWYIFVPRSRNYTATISGIPIYLDKLSCETLAEDKVDAYDARSGLYLPARGYNATPAKAWRKELVPGEIKLDEIKLDKMPVMIEGGLPAATE